MGLMLGPSGGLTEAREQHQLAALRASR